MLFLRTVLLECWRKLKSEKRTAPSLVGVFGSDKLGQAVQEFVNHLVSVGRTYTTVAGYVKSFIAVATFVHAARKARASSGETVSSAPVEAMRTGASAGRASQACRKYGHSETQTVTGTPRSLASGLAQNGCRKWLCQSAC